MTQLIHGYLLTLITARRFQRFTVNDDPHR
jgi:hypothetical protein